MSTWHEVHETDIVDIDHQAKEVNILISEDENGNIYVSLTFKQIESLYKSITKT